MMKISNHTKGHLLAFFCTFVWGTTYISSKILLRFMTPTELLFTRFVIGYIALWIMYPHPVKTKGLREELYFAGAGLTGITLYYLLENVALVYTLASNVGVIVAIVPFFTAFLAFILGDRSEVIKPRFLIGFVISMIGVVMMSFGGSGIELHLLGDLLALLAALMWPIYCMISKKAAGFGYDLIPTTRRMFMYGLIFMIIPVFVSGYHVDFRELIKPVYLFNLLFLGVFGCAICFVTWNTAVKLIGAVRTSVYIYMTPVITTVTSVLILRENITPAALAGIVLTLFGLIFSKDSRNEA